METQDERFFSPSEQAQIRANIREATKLAMDEQIKRGHKPHPRIVEMKKEK